MSNQDVETMRLAIKAVMTGKNPGQLVVVGHPVPLDVLLELAGPEDRLRVAALSHQNKESHVKLTNGMEVVRIT